MMLCLLVQPMPPRFFFKRATSSLLDIAELLREEHSIQVANYQISLALENYLQSLKSKNISFPQGISYDLVRKLRREPKTGQQEFDQTVIPLLLSCFEQYKPFIKQNNTDQEQYNSVIESLRNLASLYEKNDHPPQNYADVVIAQAFETLAHLFDMYNDQLA